VSNNTDEQSVRVGLIGAGSMAKSHAWAFANAPLLIEACRGYRIELAAVFDPNSAASQALSTTYHIPMVGDVETILDDPTIDAVVISTPNRDHAPLAVAALRAGKHVWSEKPMAATIGDASEMYLASKDAVAVSDRSTLKTLVGFSYIYNPVQAKARKLVADGLIGDLVDCRCRFDQGVLAGEDRPFEWRFDREIAGSGALGDLGSHAIALLHYITGDRIASVSGVTITSVPKRPNPKGGAEYLSVTNEDAAHAVGHFRSGALFHAATSRVALGEHLRLAYEIYGTKGSIRFDQQNQNELLVTGVGSGRFNDETVVVPIRPDDGPFGSSHGAPGIPLGVREMLLFQVAEFISSIRNGQEPRTNFEFALGVEHVVDAIERSAASNKTVDVIS